MTPISFKSLTKPAITRDQLKAYAQASGDVNPIHLDETFAKEAGFPSVIAHGMLSMAFLGDAICLNFSPRTHRLTRFRCRFRKVIFPGDSLTCKGTVDSEEPSGLIKLNLQIENQNGELTADGDAELVSNP